MSGQAASKLIELGIELPKAPKPIASYVPYQIIKDLVFISGQLPMKNGAILHKGLLGMDLTLEEGKEAAKICAINILAQLNDACNGDLDNVKQCVRIGGFVASGPDFEQHPHVINGASDLIHSVFEEKGLHSRAAIGVSSLPLGACVEVEAIFEIKNDKSMKNIMKSAFS